MLVDPKYQTFNEFKAQIQEVAFSDGHYRASLLILSCYDDYEGKFRAFLQAHDLEFRSSLMKDLDGDDKIIPKQVRVKYSELYTVHGGKEIARPIMNLELLFRIVEHFHFKLDDNI